MDALSVTASLVALVHLTTEITKGIKSYCKGVKNASKEVTELMDELTAFHAILKQLQDISSKNDLRLPMLKRMVETDGPLAKCFQQMTGFQKKLVGGQSRIRKSLKWPFERAEIHTVTTHLRNLRSVLDTAIASDQLGMNLQIQDNVIHIASSLGSTAQRKMSRQISTWLSAPDPSINYRMAREKRHRDTGCWLLDSPIFQDWKNRAHTFLWLHGKAGSGKTILSSTAIRHLVEVKESSSVVLYFYFDFQIREKQTLGSFLSSAVNQIFDRSSESFEIAEKVFKANNEGRSKPSVRELKEALRQMLGTFTSVYMVLDALDECEEKESLLEHLEDILEWNQEGVHIFATSRPHPDIEDSLNPIVTGKISLEENVVSSDIVRFVRDRLQNDAKLSKWSEDIRNEIENALTDGANGMFRWVVCQLDAIRGCMKPKILRQTLQSLPKTLDETYYRMVKNIPEEHVEDARRILACLICSFVPLDIAEVADTAAIVVEGPPHYDTESRLLEPRDVLRICAGLVSTVHSFRKYRLFDNNPVAIEELRIAHFSVKEYLVSSHAISAQRPVIALEERLAHETLVELCLACLYRCEKEDFFEEAHEPRTILEIAPFAPYAASFWARHLKSARLEASSPCHKKALAMLSRPPLLRDVIRMTSYLPAEDAWPWENPRRVFNTDYNGFHDIAVGDVSPLYYAATLEPKQLVSSLLAAGEGVNSSGPAGTCLAMACLFRRISAAQLLLEKDADPNMTVSEVRDNNIIKHSKTPVHYLCSRRSCSNLYPLLELLVAAGADLNLGCYRDGEYGGPIHEAYRATPLQEAIFWSYNPQFIKFLLVRGAEVNACIGMTPLELVAGKKETNETRENFIMLLDAGADPNLTSDPNGVKTPIHRAVFNGNFRFAESLIDRGAKISSLKYALIYAADCGLIEHVNLILGYKVSPDARDQKGRTALVEAARSMLYYKKRLEVAKVLLNAGADVNLPDASNFNALQAAAHAANPWMVQLLLEKGATPNYSGGHGTALQIVTALREHQGSQDGQASSEISGDEIVHLIDRSPSRTAADDQKVVQLLLAHGASDI